MIACHFREECISQQVKISEYKQLGQQIGVERRHKTYSYIASCHPGPFTEGACNDDIGQRHDQHIRVNVLQQPLSSPLTALVKSTSEEMTAFSTYCL